jgi:hypothetical protein
MFYVRTIFHGLKLIASAMDSFIFRDIFPVIMFLNK